MAAVTVNCPQCQQALPAASARELLALLACPTCNRPLEVTPLPGFGRDPVVGRTGVNRMGDSEAACFFHGNKQAEVPCDRCGRFLCALCRLELDGQSICPTCLNSTSGAPGTSLTLRECFRWDLMVWMLAIGPLVTLCLWWLTPLTCLAAIVIGIWKLKSPTSRIHRSRGWLVAGLLVAMAVLGASAVVILLVLTQSD